MDEPTQHEIQRWLVTASLSGRPEVELMRGFCDRCRSHGLPLSRGLIFIDTLHPIFEGRGVRWDEHGLSEAELIEYGRTNEGEAAANWRRTPFYWLLENGKPDVQLRLDGALPMPSTMLADLAAQGHVDYFACVHRLESETTIGEMDCVYSHWTTRRPEGFSDIHIKALRNLVPALALAIKSAALAKIADTLAHVYLGRDAGQRVLSGRILRGVADPINAILWFSDLRGYTAISDSADPAELIPLLNDYAEAAITAICNAGGDVLKLIGDGVLAIFNEADASDAARAALRAEREFRNRIADLASRRTSEGRPTTTAYVALHSGTMFFGNIGSHERLDFTVVGPAVNEASRILSMCRSVDRDLLVSTEFQALLDPVAQAQFVSVGRFALRGITRSQELFTLDPAIRLGGAPARHYERMLAQTG
ncbi:adenylate/guanylate cyclase domain-containing protein [Rhodoligotrophos defluvii]|uniref:adenylate/guanylate cyclase domain-containing protein n=1 Tax=Rhodoligotrophos defluvii TaxID=2561934 RepID=UPI0010C93FC1|nr:adenylate/guanylate cyclase domain-containing protein [Rhodoligotrophos defluvii]